jgi:hypothetical protein
MVRNYELRKVENFFFNRESNNLQNHVLTAARDYCSVAQVQTESARLVGSREHACQVKFVNK